MGQRVYTNINRIFYNNSKDMKTILELSSNNLKQLKYYKWLTSIYLKEIKLLRIAVVLLSIILTVVLIVLGTTVSSI